MNTKLKTGDLVEVHGWVMLQRLPSGRYRVKVEDRVGQSAYAFTRPKGRKVVITHWAANVDPWVRPVGDSDMNKIVVVATG